MVVLGWIIIGVLVACFLFIPPALVGYNYFRELGVWLSMWALAGLVTALIVFGVYAALGAFG